MNQLNHKLHLDNRRTMMTYSIREVRHKLIREAKYISQNIIRVYP